MHRMLWLDRFWRKGGIQQFFPRQQYPRPQFY
jgi:hypothetical protein